MNARMRTFRTALGTTALLCLGLLAVELAPAVAKPPPHAPAHGYRRKQGGSTTYTPRTRTYNERYEDRYRSRYPVRTRTRTRRTVLSRAKDIDRDGIPNYRDPDMDGDRIRNERDRDVDGDGALNTRDRHPRNPMRR